MTDALNESIAFSGRIGEVIHTTQPDGRIFERYRRPPGVRLILVTPENKIIMNREVRQETGGIDLRLPGGKVCDSLAEYHALLESGESIIDATNRAAVTEARQEVGVDLHDSQFVTCAVDGATVEWDLFYFQSRNYSDSPDGQQLEAGEQIERVELSPAEIRHAIAGGQMAEWRSVGVLLGIVLPALEA